MTSSYFSYFQKGIDNGKCPKKSNEKFTFIECDNDSDPSEGSLTLGFDNWDLIFNNKSVLFQNCEDGIKKKFVLYYEEGIEKFILWRALLKELDMVYDYANKEIGFHSNNGAVKHTEKGEPKPQKIYLFLDDEEEFGTKKVKEKRNLLPAKNPEETKIEDSEDVFDGSNATF